MKKAPETLVKRPHATNGSVSVRSKYTPEVKKKVLTALRKGNSIRDAGLLAGLGKDTLDTWLHYGRHQPEKYPHFAELAADVEVARAEMRASAVDNIVTVANSQAPGTWQANAWYLERTDPENWGRKDKVEHVGNDAPRTQLNTVVLIDSDAREAARDLLTRIAGNAGADESVGPGSRLQLEAGDS